jgi:hypothetical protein
LNFVDGPLFLPKKKCAKRCVPCALLELFRDPCGLKNSGAVLFLTRQKEPKKKV